MLYRTPPRRRRHALAAVAASALAGNALWAPLPGSAQGNHDLQINLSANATTVQTKVEQKGALLNGRTIGQYLSSHPNVLVGIRNSNGGVATYRHPQ